MWRLRSPRISHLVGRLSQINVVSDVKVQQYRCCQTLVSPPPSSLQQTKYDPPDTVVPRIYIGENISRKDKTKYLYSTLLELNDSKETVYGALDAWVAWEQNFPIASLKTILNSLEKEQQWHRVVQTREEESLTPKKIHLSENDPIGPLHQLADIITNESMMVTWDSTEFGRNYDIPLYLHKDDVMELAEEK
ncbi:uncharacterized protein LOC108325443 isoform X3 [Vigna angularis]|uniref:uncharacterized protein LOC108325443 isoform X3 n=1 Tax=Phaseolus angularis TaxID=3914 RepID=UPI0022B2C2C3|nr:uncharacterized protein LOC108325443 isoform X3 [Vigna angularis]